MQEQNMSIKDALNQLAKGTTITWKHENQRDRINPILSQIYKLPSLKSNTGA
jgi:hypothetical protein